MEGLDRAESLPALAQVLRSQGFEPQVRGDEVVLSNCPFDALAKKHTALVCGLNQSFVQGVADGLDSRRHGLPGTRTRQVLCQGTGRFGV